MNEEVEKTTSTWKTTPQKFEAGTMPIAGVIGLKEAVLYLEKISLRTIKMIVDDLYKYLIEQLSRIPEVKIYNPDSDTGIITFNLGNIPAHDAITYYAMKNIALRSGQHCAKLIHDFLGIQSSLRASVYFYNTKEEVDEFIKTETSFVVIDKSQQKIEEIYSEYKFPYIDGDPTNDKVLKRAEIESAKGLITSLETDHENLFLVISARNLNPKVKIVAKVIDPNAKDKMLRAGANETISPSHIGGLRIASVMIRPNVVTFLDSFLRGEGTTRFQEIILNEKSTLVGKNFDQAQEAEETGLSVIAIKKKGADKYICNPRTKVQMESGDILVTLGDVKQKDEFVKKFN